MAQEIIYLTAEGYKKIKDELEHMRSVERPAISAAIAEARDKGDLSENAEYDAAREAQGLLEMRIAKLEDTMANAAKASWRSARLSRRRCWAARRATVWTWRFRPARSISRSSTSAFEPPGFFRGCPLPPGSAGQDIHPHL